MSELVDCTDSLSAKDIIRRVSKTANGTPFYINTLGLSGFCAEYQAVYDAMTTPPSAAISEAQNTMWCAIVDAGIAAKLDVFYCYAQHTNAASEALINWINPGTFDGVLAGVPNPVFVALEGFTSDGSNGYINCNWNTNTDSVNFQQNGCSLGAYSRTNLNQGGYLLGSRNGPLTILNPRNATSNYQIYVNTGTVDAAANADSTGLFIANRDAANNQDGYRNGVLVVNGVQVSTGVPNANLYVLCYNSSGSPTSFTTRQVSFAFAGASLDANDRTNLQNAIETYMDSNGKGVIP